MISRTVLFALVLTPILAAGAARADLATGVGLFERAEFDAAAEVLKPLAGEGDPQAQYVLGVMYLNEMVEPPSPSAAQEMFQGSAEAGYGKAQTELARMYRDGDGVEQDFVKSLEWSIIAAEAGDVGAQLQVADSYAFGYGTEQNRIEAYKWYEIAMRYWGSLAVNARDLVAESMKPEEIEDATLRAEAWLRAHE